MALDPDQAAELLAAALASPAFVRSRRQSDLLAHLVAEELAGRGDQLNAYALAFDVFKREADFDPSTDSAVRVEMHRLRTNLDVWNADPANHHPLALTIAPRQYRPQIQARVDAPAPIAPRGASSRLAAVWGALPAALRRYGLIAVLALGALVLYGGQQWRAANVCHSARPELALPETIPGLPADAAASLLKRLDTYLGYYPLVSTPSRWWQRCRGVPRFDLGIAASGGQGKELQFTLTDKSSESVVWHNEVPTPGAGEAADRAMAQVAYRLGYDNGAVPNAALRNDWEAPVAEAEFRCVMRAHQFFYNEGDIDTFQQARACLAQYYRSSWQADLPAMFAALEIFRHADPALRGVPGPDYYDQAARAAERIDPQNSELLIIQLRHARDQGRLAEVQMRLKLMASVYPFEPHILNQVARAEAQMLGQYQTALERVARARAIAGFAVDGYATVPFCNIGLGRPQDNGPYYRDLALSVFPKYQLTALNYADASGDAGALALTMDAIGKSACHDHACLLNALQQSHWSDDLQSALRRSLDRHFPVRPGG